MNRTASRTLATLGLAAALAASSAQAQAPIDCRVVERIGNTMRADVIAAIDADIAGDEYEISRRKTLTLIGVEDVSFEGCKLRAKVGLSLERKIRRDADGHAWVTGTVVSYGLRPEPWVCLDNKPKVQRLELSNTLNIGERIYTRIANRTFPPGRCFPVGIAPAG